MIVKQRPHLGLVCISASNEIRFRTITRTRYLSLAQAERKATLRALYEDNLARLLKALDFCKERDIKLYRATSAMFPMNDLDEDSTGSELIEEMQEQLAAVGKKATELGIRVVLHPDQFVVLSSESPRVVQASIKVMQMHAHVFDLFGLPQTTWAAMILHGGKSNRSEAMVEEIKRLPDNIRNRLVLENDEHAYGAAQILEVCQKAGIPMVFDVHHHVCHEKLDSFEDPSIGEMLAQARTTWPILDWQLTHISNGKTAMTERSHSDFIETVPSAFENAPWIEVEAKAKEEAIAKLRILWPIAD